MKAKQLKCRKCGSENIEKKAFIYRNETKHLRGYCLDCKFKSYYSIKFITPDTILKCSKNRLKEITYPECSKEV